MHVVAAVIGISLCIGALLDAFQTIILPRRPNGRFRLTRLFYIMTWNPWSAMTRRIKDDRLREQVFSIYGPMSLLLLLLMWAVLLITGFGLIYFALGTPFTDAMMTHYGRLQFELWTDLYVSGTTLFTLGLGDVVPKMPVARGVIILESGVGLGLVALVVGYLPVLYGAFSRREVSVALLDARAGSPPTAAELLSRHSFNGGQKALIVLLAEWERWAAELLESHVSYPILCYYRSQHDNQSWLSALVTVLDTCALMIASVQGTPARQAQLTFAMARHAVIDLCHVFHLEQAVERKRSEGFNRLPPEQFGWLCRALGETEIELCGDAASSARLHELREMYEPHAQALAYFLGLTVPMWIAPPKEKDQWRRVEKLRSDGGLLGRQSHVSERSTAAHLGDEGHG